MSTILTAERELYEVMWALPEYAAHAPGEHYLPLFLQMVGPERGTVLDAGTGSGKGAFALRRAGFDVTACDITDAGLVPDATTLPFVNACLWHRLGVRGEFDYVYCTDVLEHIPPQFTMLAIHQMLQVCSKGLFLTVSLVPDSFGVWAGKSLHQSVYSFVWWRDALNEVGIVKEARDLITNGVYFVRPR